MCVKSDYELPSDSSISSGDKQVKQEVIPDDSTGQQETSPPASGGAPSGVGNQEEVDDSVLCIDESLQEKLGGGVERIHCDVCGCQGFRWINTTICSLQAMDLYRLHLSVFHNSPQEGQAMPSMTLIGQVSGEGSIA